MPPRSVARAWPLLDPLLFGGMLAAYALATPLGLARAGAGAVVAQGATLGEVPAGAAPLPLLAVRLLCFLPLGDVATRASLASALAAAVAAMLLARVCCEALRAVRPAPAVSSLVEPVAAAGAAALVGLSLGAFGDATGAGTMATTLALVAGAWLCGLRLLRAPEATRAGATLALLAGLAAGVDRAAVPLVWLPALALWLRSLRRGERWPLLAPALFVAGLGVVLFGAAVAEPRAGMMRLLAGLWPGRGTAATAVVRAAVAEAGEQLGVVALCLAAAGTALLLARAPLVAAFMLWPVVVAASLSAVPLAAAAVAVPLAVGIAQLAGKIGRARVAAAVTVAIIASVAPLLDGGAARWTHDARLPGRLLDRALAEVPLRGEVSPGSPEMTALFHYGRALGLRPDVTLTGP